MSTRKQFTPAERKAYRDAQRAEATSKFEAALLTMTTEEGFERWVRARAQFHDYSWGNTLLILMQNPEATRCASYKTWQKLGRQVRKGEKGLWIRVPSPIILRDKDRQPIIDEATGKPKRIMTFKGGTTFDVSQTDGDPLPEPPPVQPLSGDSHEHLLAPLEAMAADLGFTVEYRDLSDRPEGGWCNSLTREIVVDSSEAPNMQVHTLTHEIAHALGVTYTNWTRPEAETIVEAAAYIALTVAGLDAGNFAVGYVAGWSKGSADLMKRVGSKIDECAKALGLALDAQTNGAEAVAA